jgi:tartrate dehydrogenase/decarboxylase/D-malate dehydrogenase
MMLDFLGYKEAHDKILNAIEACLDPLNQGPRTPDLGGDAKCSDVGMAIAGFIGSK